MLWFVVLAFFLGAFSGAVAIALCTTTASDEWSEERWRIDALEQEWGRK